MDKAKKTSFRFKERTTKIKKLICEINNKVGQT